jgi:hypothetical protein
VGNVQVGKCPCLFLDKNHEGMKIEESKPVGLVARGSKKHDVWTDGCLHHSISEKKNYFRGRFPSFLSTITLDIDLSILKIIFLHLSFSLYRATSAKG